MLVVGELAVAEVADEQELKIRSTACSSLHFHRYPGLGRFPRVLFSHCLYQIS